MISKTRRNIFGINVLLIILLMDFCRKTKLTQARVSDFNSVGSRKNWERINKRQSIFEDKDLLSNKHRQHLVIGSSLNPFIITQQERLNSLPNFFAAVDGNRAYDSNMKPVSYFYSKPLNDDIPAEQGNMQNLSSAQAPQHLNNIYSGEAAGSYGALPNAEMISTASPYAGYLEKQINSFPIMLYTLNDCIPCQKAKHLLASSYPNVHAHFLELSGNEPWQQQLQIDLQYLTSAITFPYIFVCGQYIGGASDLFEWHENGQLRTVVSQCLKKSSFYLT